ncbi:phage major capsid protein, P2 family [Xanthomonas translucens]|uniref:phage major capsid protein, P2 family n=1 Tax=Xanthomonas campestris pv. translucens TaxID=343 RepID=UPI0019D56EC9|nr:phage major capsid protein, P2 family [Xanthomonas translucens]MCT8273345.1 phage major capsid protein, P2 family [Xanthomonas translucens pv. translucens]MCT8277511.1 phage major capsid protein, P2 family [Xanthomonas translucens pv. translucens]MCT8306296.1 phage major capsid protein, P2 family [Xanthomonas translucens pv. translucens]QSQ38939.1 phage major capsid protein, P2 family [Xanthomonas translucens pv. translucens]UII65667.1 phage major capsid protein, P2 family [Xanthomonas tran
MRNDTRLHFNKLMEQIAKLNGVASAAVSFNVEPTTQQKLETRMQESSDFLGKINLIGVDELTGEKVGIGVSGTIAGRTDTSGAGVRQPRNVAALDNNKYTCQHTDFDTAIPYALLDAWAKFPDFQTRIRDAIIQRQALDRILIGFNGTSVAATTNRDTSPLLQDVNKGWLQQYRDNAPQRVMATGKTAGKVIIGAGGDYTNLDALVYDVISNLIDPWHRRDPGLVVVLGRDLMHDKYFPLVNKDQPATEKLATDMILSQKRVGGLQAVEVPYVPDGTLMVTSLANLSLYYQLGGRRRYIKEAPEKNRIENYESSNDAYVIEDYGLGCVVEKIGFEV